MGPTKLKLTNNKLCISIMSRMKCHEMSIWPQTNLFINLTGGVGPVFLNLSGDIHCHNLRYFITSSERETIMISINVMNQLTLPLTISTSHFTRLCHFPEVP